MRTIPFRLENLDPEITKVKEKGKFHEFKKIILRPVAGVKYGQAGFQLSNNESAFGKVEATSSWVDEKKSSYDKGFNEGQEMALMKLNELLGALGLMSHELGRKIEGLENEGLIFSINLAVQIAEKIIGNELTMKGDIILDVVKRVLGNLPKSKEIKIKLNPIDLERFKSCHPKVEELIAKMGDSPIFDADEKVKSGGCLINTDTFFVDSTIDKQLELISSRLLEEANNSVKS